MWPDKIVNGKNTTALAFIVFLLFVVYRVVLIFFPSPDIGGVEGNVVYFIQRILDGQSFYTDPEQAPYAIAQYSPLYYYLVAGVAKLCGISADDVFSVFVTGRIVSLVLNLGTISVVYYLCRNIFSVSFRRSLVAAVMTFIFLQLTSFARPDSLYHFFSLISVYFFWGSIKKENSGWTFQRKQILLAAFFSVITIFSKQTGFILPLVMGTCFLIFKQYKALLYFSTVYILVLVLMLAGVYAITGITLFYKNAILGINNGISLGWYKNEFINSFYLKWGLLLVPLFIIVLNFARQEKDRLLRCAGIMLLLIFIFLNLIGLKMGSVSGYLTEWWILLFVLVSYYWPRFVIRKYNWSNYFAPLLLCVILIIKAITIAGPLMEKTRTLSSSNRMQWYDNDKAVAAMIKSKLQAEERFPVFMNLYTPESFLSNLLFREAAAPQLDILVFSTYPRHKYNYHDLETGLQDGRFPYMIMKDNGMPKRFFDISLDKYALMQSLNGYNLYKFQP